MTLGLMLAGVIDACGGGDSRPPVESMTIPKSDGGRHLTFDAGDAAKTDSAANCGPSVCSGHGECIGVDGGPKRCVCSTGYVAAKRDGGVTECVVDETCVKLRYLEPNGCRERGDSAAVGLFFAVDYCAGTAVLPDKLGDPSSAFKVLEDGQDVKDRPETTASVIARAVESYVTFAIDVSETVTQNQSDPQRFTTLVETLRASVQSLKRPPSEPPIGVSFVVFGRSVRELMPFTTNLATADAALSALEANPKSITDSVAGTAGTALYDGIAKGIESTERIQALRDDVTDGGVLTSGAVVAITDGKDVSGAKLSDLKTNFLDKTLVNVITIGIGTDIGASDLAEIGRDGQFLAPTDADFAPAFREVAQRLQEYPKRAYFLGYCSSTTHNTHTVEISLNAVTPKQTASCTFDASLFGRNTCVAATLGSECQSQQCGGVNACGACPDGQCCADGKCQAPSAIQSGGDAGTADCLGQDELCAASGLICDPNTPNPGAGSSCHAPVPVGGACSVVARCEPGKGYCSGGKCVAVTLTDADGGAPCGTATSHPGETCSTQNCLLTDPGKPQPYTCQAPARAFDPCGGTSADAACEAGSACQNDVCKPRQIFGCTSNLDCASGFCSGNVCVSTGSCYFSWDQKMGH